MSNLQAARLNNTHFLNIARPLFTCQINHHLKFPIKVIQNSALQFRVRLSQMRYDGSSLMLLTTLIGLPGGSTNKLFRH